MTHRNRFLAGLATVCGIAWLIAAIQPLDRQAWILENILVILFVVLLAFVHGRIQLSNAAYVCLALFVLLHIAGAHYTYAKMPLGLWAKDVLGFSRNHFDRVAHFGFGFFLAFPVRELLLRFSKIRWSWSFWISATLILALSGFFEILEGIVAEIVAPGKGVNWLGGQGDQWDAQNDMLSSLLGALAMMGSVALFESVGRRPRPTTPNKTAGGEASWHQSRTRFVENRFLQIALALYAALWIALAIRPVDRGDWLLENLLVFAAAAVLIPAYRKCQLSNLSYALILVFLAFHAVGAHYTYAKVPAGFWLQDLLHLKRNHYDRVIHFAFGFLLLYPLRELFARSAGVGKAWAAWLAVASLWALSGFFEILEAIVAQMVAPDLGTAYLGTQGDVWDAQKDMSAAFVGAILVAAWLTPRRSKTGK